MKPLYQSNYIDDPNTILTDLLTLDWIQVTEARLEYFMSTEPRSYTYGKHPHDREYWSLCYSSYVLDIQDRMNTKLGTDYNICFLNRYDTQKHQLGWHADDSPSMDGNHAIAVISFGAEREIWWRINNEPGVVPPENRQLLRNGSLFIMPAGFQSIYQHRIPKADRVVGTRISLTFRRYK